VKYKIKDNRHQQIKNASLEKWAKINKHNKKTSPYSQLWGSSTKISARKHVRQIKTNLKTQSPKSSKQQMNFLPFHILATSNKITIWSLRRIIYLDISYRLETRLYRMLTNPALSIFLSFLKWSKYSSRVVIIFTLLTPFKTKYHNQITTFLFKIKMWLVLDFYQEFSVCSALRMLVSSH